MSYPNNVAIIDDDEALRLSLGALMRAYGIAAQLFETADAFLGADQSPFDCVVADVHMPGTDGITMLERLRERGNQVPVIIISALDTDSTRQRAIAKGAENYFPKPVDAAALVKFMAGLASSQRGASLESGARA